MSELKKGTARVIKIDRQAIFEFIYEKFIDDINLYFDLNKNQETIQSFIQDDKSGDFMMLVRNDCDVAENDVLSDNLGAIINKIETTTDSMYSTEKRYKEFSVNELIDLIK